MGTSGVFLDIEGAFDAILHFLLVHKLRAHGIHSNVIDIIYSYLFGRKLRVKANNSSSPWSLPGDINSGVPQGSILGPLLFIMYINNLADYVHHCKMYLCALFIPVNKNQDVRISQNLLSDLNSLSDWSNTLKLKFKGCKSKEVLFQSQKNLAIPYPILS
jgi:hypothetical protein